MTAVPGDYADLSNEALMELHEGALEALSSGRSLAEEGERVREGFGTEAAFGGDGAKEQLEAIEAVLRSRGVPFARTTEGDV